MSDTPGLAWRRNKRYTVAWWLCRQDIATAGYPIRARALWRGKDNRQPTGAEMEEIGRRCLQLQHEMLDWRWRPKGRKALRMRRNSGFVYFLRSGDLIKIGFATNIRKRITDLQIANPGELVLLASMRGSPWIEKKLHHRFRSLRSRGEWFSSGPRLLDFIKTIQERSVSGIVNDITNDTERLMPKAAA